MTRHLWHMGAALSHSRDKQSSFFVPKIRESFIPFLSSTAKEKDLLLYADHLVVTKSQNVLPNLELTTASNVSFKECSKYAQRNHLTPASNIDLLLDKISANQTHQFVAVSGSQDAEKQIRENPFPPVDANAKRSTSCPPPPPPPTSMPSCDASKSRDDYGFALYGPPRSETEPKSFAWAIDPSTAPALTTGAYRVDTPGWYVGLDGPMVLFDNMFAPIPCKLEELVWL
ncbi:hypothetical protein F5146DRAFT_1005997 [Armillaria mellea]|nr:hypothetical protein F5146DRAFT_1005997 [Armillaria mellea]